jgi:hypothetical protein
MQGFLFSKPLPPREMADLLRAAPGLASPPLQPDANDGPEQPVTRSRLKGAVV